MSEKSDGICGHDWYSVDERRVWSKVGFLSHEVCSKCLLVRHVVEEHDKLQLKKEVVEE